VKIRRLGIDNFERNGTTHSRKDGRRKKALKSRSIMLSVSALGRLKLNKIFTILDMGQGLIRSLRTRLFDRADPLDFRCSSFECHAGRLPTGRTAKERHDIIIPLRKKEKRKRQRAIILKRSRT
jgi:hypothetical protein